MESVLRILHLPVATYIIALARKQTLLAAMDPTLSTASGDPVDSEDKPPMVPSAVGNAHKDTTDDEVSAPAPPPDLPVAVIYDILTRLPPSSVTRSKIACKSWLSMISHRSFKRAHRAAWSRRAPATSVLLFDGSGGARYPATVVAESGSPRLRLRRWRAEPRDGYAVQNCCGPLACLRTGRGNAQLLNPATGRSLPLGGGSRTGDRCTWTHADHLPWYCLGRCAATGAYKVVRLDVRLPFRRVPHLTCAVLTVGPDSWDPRGRFKPAWKEVGRPWDASLCPTGRGVHVAGVVYYLSWPIDGAAVVVSFNLNTHELSVVGPPGGIDIEGHLEAPSLSLLELDGRLCASRVGPSDGGGGAEMRVYMLGDGQQVWAQMCRFELHGNVRRAPRPLLLRGHKMLVKRADGSLCNHDMDDQGVATNEKVVFDHKVGLKQRRQPLSGATADVFVESLLPLRTILGAPPHDKSAS